MSAMSWVESETEGSSSAWHSSASTPESSAKLPMAEVGKARTRFVSSEKLAQMKAEASAGT